MDFKSIKREIWDVIDLTHLINVNKQVCGEVSEQVWQQIINQIIDQVGIQLKDQVLSQVISLVDFRVRRQIEELLSGT